MSEYPEELSLKLREKYDAYRVAYDKKDYWLGEDKLNFDPKGTPELLDACFTGCDLPGAKHTHRNYTLEIENDIKEIIKQSRCSIYCNMGHMRCRDYVTPLDAACMNTNIPIHMIEYLLDKGADQYVPIKVGNQYRLIIDDLEKHIDSVLGEDRYQKIKELFEKYEGNGGRHIKG